MQDQERLIDPCMVILNIDLLVSLQIAESRMLFLTPYIVHSAASSVCRILSHSLSPARTPDVPTASHKQQRLSGASIIQYQSVTGAYCSITAFASYPCDADHVGSCATAGHPDDCQGLRAFACGRKAQSSTVPSAVIPSAPPSRAALTAAA